MPPPGRNGLVYDNHILSIPTHLRYKISSLLSDFRNIAREFISSVNKKGFTKSSFQFLSIFINNCSRSNLPISKYFKIPIHDQYTLILQVVAYKRQLSFFMIRTSLMAPDLQMVRYGTVQKPIIHSYYSSFLNNCRYHTCGACSKSPHL